MVPAAELEVTGLWVRLRLPRAWVAAVSDVSFRIRPGECLALVGESGCGKSVLAAALLGFLPANAQVAGAATLRSESRPPIELLSAPERVLARAVRGRRIRLIPQSPAAHLTPVRTVRSQLEEMVRTHHPAVANPRARAEHYAASAGLRPTDLDCYPHELSGGMAQRAATALALVAEPWLLIADEPTTGLDRELVEAFLDELRRLVEQHRAVLLITHDLAAARRVADRIAVMYAGRFVELGPAASVLDQPQHPYTHGLIESLPERAFTPIPGMPPLLTDLPSGCPFHPRCQSAVARCRQCPPPLEPAQAHAPVHDVACYQPWSRS
jgi:peptide/nickel transport system ATP-binding protein